MPVNTDAIGKQWPAAIYEVGAEKIREFATAIGAENPVHFEHEAAKSAGYRDLVAPPMFCVVYSARAMGPAILDPEVGINKEIYEKDGKGFYVFETISTNQDGRQVVKGTWTNIVRGV
jgi:acyl dehydratase